jgi:hypothetical protein
MVYIPYYESMKSKATIFLNSFRGPALGVANANTGARAQPTAGVEGENPRRRDTQKANRGSSRPMRLLRTADLQRICSVADDLSTAHLERFGIGTSPVERSGRHLTSLSSQARTRRLIPAR